MTDTPVSSLATICGATCVAIGVGHALGGTHTVPGTDSTNATVDSQERFYGAVFALYGLGWIKAAQRTPPDLITIDALSLGMLAGAGARLISLAERGRPHQLYQVLTGVEVAVPSLFLALTRRVRRRP